MYDKVLFHIDCDKPHRHEVGEDLPDDQAAWQSATQLVRDIETNLKPGQSWWLDVRHGRAAVYLVEIKGHRWR